MEHHGAGAHQRPVLDRAALEVGEVADHAAGTDDGGVLVGGVHDGAVLHARPLPHLDVAVVAPQDRTGPDGGAGTDHDIADHGGVRVDVGVGVHVGHPLAEGVDGHDPERTAVARTRP